ncbi:hypothetical protein GQ55_9G114800 [Panicum hallii var. hallii]|uniref:Uncharacterized protein n=1 Tax=Panicum hallii var. hallii TaxID=1504633 RepID=A0A2T7C224_9POAL|nr:hypothetical protein GQ55_9G114800 [Panicum hallii var. hallii]
MAPTCRSMPLPPLRSAVACHSCPPAPRRSRRPLHSSRPHLAVLPPCSSRPHPPKLLLSRRPVVPVQLFNRPCTLSNARPSSNPRSTDHAVIAGPLDPFVLGPRARRGDKEKEKERADVSIFISIDGDWFLPPSTLLMSCDPDRDQAGFILDCTI